MRVNTKKPLSFFWPQSQLKMLHNSISSFITFRCNKDGARGHRRSQGKVRDLGTLGENFTSCTPCGDYNYANNSILIGIIRSKITRDDPISFMEFYSLELRSDFNTFTRQSTIQHFFQRLIMSHKNNKLGQIKHVAHWHAESENCHALQCSLKTLECTGKYLSFYFWTIGKTLELLVLWRTSMKPEPES